MSRATYNSPTLCVTHLKVGIDILGRLLNLMTLRSVPVGWVFKKIFPNVRNPV
jgi:hypothetical protein